MLQTFRYISGNIFENRFINFGSIICKSAAYGTIGMTAEHHTAGLIVIGDEILKAQVKDTNSHFMCKKLYECGVKVRKISVIGDDVDVIANEIRDFSNKYTYVITSGGIGPTHDDVTFEALAKAFDDSLHYHPTLVDVVKKLFAVEDPEKPGFKLANIPTKATLKFGVNPQTGKPSNYPCIILKNIHVFPGSPFFLEQQFSSLYKELFKTDRKFVKDEIYINAKEDSYAAALTTVATQYPRVTFGSYPIYDERGRYKARVTIESDNEDETSQARDKFISLIPSKVLVEKLEP